MSPLPVWIRRSAGRQIIIATVLLLAVTSLVTGWYNVESQRKALLRETEKRGSMLVQTAATMATEPMLSEAVDYPVLETFAETMVQQGSAVRVEIKRGDKVVASAGVHVADVDEYSQSIHKPRLKGRPGDVIGRVTVALSTAEAKRAIAASRQRLILQGVVTFGLLALLLSWALRHLVTQPLRRLALQARRLGKGDLDTEIQLNTHDEFGKLAGVLEDMRDRLSCSYREIQEQNSRLREVDYLKSRFLATMSHEIRTPMNGILGFAELLKQSDLDSEQRSMAETVVGSANSLLQIINEILDLSKIEAGQLRLETIEFDFGDLVAEVRHLLMPSAEAKGLRFETEIDRRIPPILIGDPLRVRQVLTNLLSNAIKFTETGRIVLRASQSKSSDDDVELRIEVQDTGIGLDEASLAKLFQAFSQADASTTRRYGGTGLGLAICKHLVELMGGEIGATSTEGQGSTFWITLSCRRASADCQHDSDQGLLRGSRILVMDADRPSCESTRMLLDSWKIESTRAGTADEAFDMVRAAYAAKTPYQAFLIDVAVVPRGDIRAFIDRLSAVSGEPELPVILTASEHGFLQDWDTLGVQVALRKPYRASQLFSAIMDVVHQRRGGVPLQETAAAPSQTVEEPDADHNRTRHVLLVEDNPVNQKLALHILSKAGYDVDVANNGQEALDAVLAKDGPFDAILMDCQMPVMDGYTATERIRQLPGDRASAPIIAMTAHAMKGDRERCLEAGMNAYLAKPVNFAELRQVVATWSGARGSELAGSKPQDEA